MADVLDVLNQLATLEQRRWTVNFDEDYETVGGDGLAPTARKLTLRKANARIVIQPKIGPADAGVLGYTAALHPSDRAADDIGLDRLYAVSPENLTDDSNYDLEPGVRVMKASRLPAAPGRPPRSDAPHPELFSSFDAAFEHVDALLNAAKRWDLTDAVSRHPGTRV